MVENDITAQNLQSAYGGESQAYQRYIVWGDKAKEDGFSNIALLFKAIAFAEQVHAGNHFWGMENLTGEALVASGGMFGIGTTSENLQQAKEGEDFEIEEMYPSYYVVAEHQTEANAMTSFRYALEAEKIHSQLFEEAREAVEAGNDYQLEYVSVCEGCGHTTIDEIPEECPTCRKDAKNFKKFNK